MSLECPWIAGTLSTWSQQVRRWASAYGVRENDRAPTFCLCPCPLSRFASGVPRWKSSPPRGRWLRGHASNPDRLP
jgi:hypothetical protein